MNKETQKGNIGPNKNDKIIKNDPKQPSIAEKPREQTRSISNVNKKK